MKEQLSQQNMSPVTDSDNQVFKLHDYLISHPNRTGELIVRFNYGLWGRNDSPQQYRENLDTYLQVTHRLKNRREAGISDERFDNLQRSIDDVNDTIRFEVAGKSDEEIVADTKTLHDRLKSEFAVDDFSPLTTYEQTLLLGRDIQLPKLSSSQIGQLFGISEGVANRYARNFIDRVNRIETRKQRFEAQ